MNIKTGQSADQAARKFLSAIKKSDPNAYQVIIAEVNRPKQMAGMNGLWDDIKTGIGNLATQGIEFYQNREAARQAQKLAEEQAKTILLEQEAVLKRVQLEQESARIQAEIERERLDLLRIAKDIEFSSVQKIGLWIAAGLGAFLIWNRMK